jgi:hypothetical protein
VIYFVRTGAVAPGKGIPASAFAQKIVDYWKTNYDTELELRRPIGGNPNRIAFVSRYKDLAEFDAVSQKSMADKKYLELLTSASDLWIAGSLRDEIWRSA